jgi:hypothetical protein
VAVTLGLGVCLLVGVGTSLWLNWGSVGEPARAAAGPSSVALTAAPTSVALAAAPTSTSQTPTALPAVPLTRQPTALAVAVPTLAALPPASTPVELTSTASPRLPRTVFSGSFLGGPLTGWPNDETSTAWFASDGYHLLARQSGQVVAIALPGGDRLESGAIDLTVRKVGGPPGGGIGVIVHDQEPAGRNGTNQNGAYHVLAIGDRGEVGIWRRAGDQWVDLVPWTASTLVKQGPGENQLSVRFAGAQLRLLVNDVEAASAEDATLTSGGVGIFVGGDLNEALLTRMTVTTSD